MENITKLCINMCQTGTEKKTGRKFTEMLLVSRWHNYNFEKYFILSGFSEVLITLKSGKYFKKR